MTKRTFKGAVLLDEIDAAALWLAQTSGYVIEVGVRWSLTDGGVLRVQQLFARACTPGRDGEPGHVVHEFKLPASLDRFESLEAMLMYELNSLGAAMDNAQ